MKVYKYAENTRVYKILNLENLKKIGIETIFNLKEITYLGFTNVILNLFKIKCTKW